jgi:hypothetical protein
MKLPHPWWHRFFTKLVKSVTIHQAVPMEWDEYHCKRCKKFFEVSKADGKVINIRVHK